MGYATDYIGKIELRNLEGRPVVDLPDDVRAFVAVAAGDKAAGPELPTPRPERESQWELEQQDDGERCWYLRQRDDAGNDYDAREWLGYFAKQFPKQFNITLSGVVHWRGEDIGDLGTVVVLGGQAKTYDGWVPMDTAELAARGSELRRPGECARMAWELLKLGTYHSDGPMDDSETLMDSITDAVSDLAHLALSRGLDVESILARAHRNAVEERVEAQQEAVRMAREDEDVELLAYAADVMQHGGPVDLLGDGLRALAETAKSRGQIGPKGIDPGAQKEGGHGA